jgi:hypothetical protein
VDKTTGAITATCPEGRYVIVKQETRAPMPMKICEVIVETVLRFNPAMGKRTAMSSIYNEFRNVDAHGYKCVDGHLSSIYQERSCCHTKDSSNRPYFLVDLGKPYKIHSISTLSRGEHDKDLSSITIYTTNGTGYNGSSKTICNQYNGKFLLGEAKSVHCKSAARTIIIQKEVPMFVLAFCELVVEADCDDGKYGRNCWNTCGNCKKNGCDKVTGTCLNSECMPGYNSTSCQQKCNPGNPGNHQKS